MSSGRDHFNREERFCDMMHQMDVTATRTKYENMIFTCLFTLTHLYNQQSSRCAAKISVTNLSSDQMSNHLSLGKEKC